MASDRRYYDDSYTTRFTGEVAAVGEHAGKPAVELASTWFYPESGGQLADRGAIGSAALLDVQVGDDDRVWHVVDAPPAGGPLECSIDWARRFDHMQQHTGQHILSAAFERLLDAPTLSSTLGAERSVIEVGLADVDWRTVERVEEAANRVLWDDRALKLHWTDDAHVGEFPLRKPPKVTGRIRVVEVPDWDWSACGGTHTRRTGEVGAVKIVGWERLRGNVRFAFLCGGRALKDHAWRTEALLEAAKRRSRSDRELVAHLERALEERDELRKRLSALSVRLLADEARAAVGSPPRPVRVLATERSRDEVRAFALQCLETGAPWVISAATAPEPALVIARAKTGQGALDLRSLVPALLAAARGKGGGSPDMVTVAPADAEGARAAFETAVAALAEREAT
ncbi:MAG TPA: alanyl-tRNA editing protein [Methylomirabilota bacterium]|nr:alanyl-tRNA editing protein [Methylomirabilota bacterium]